MQRTLSLDRTPPLSAPLRFFLTAPFFAMAAGLLLVWQGPALLASRWMPGTLAATHLITLGFLGLTMVGALIQILQVAAGVEIPRVRLTVSAVYLLLAAGAALLPCAFLHGQAWLFRIALACLAPGFGWLLVSCVLGVWRAPHGTSAFAAIRYAIAGLAVTVALGLSAATVFGWSAPLPLEPLANLHAGWGMLAWIGLLVAGVAFQVVPMFQVTELYPQLVSRWLARGVFGGLAVWTAASAWRPEALHGAARTGLLFAATAYGVFGVTTLFLIFHRKRPRLEATTLFWYLSLASLLAAIALWVLALWHADARQAAAFPLLVGILILIGFACSVANGMLYKIVPFLIWYHLQEKLGPLGIKAPNVRQVIDEEQARRQFYLHAAACAVLVAAVFVPQLARMAGALFAADAGMLLVLLGSAANRYRRALRLHGGMAPGAPS